MTISNVGQTGPMLPQNSTEASAVQRSEPIGLGNVQPPRDPFVGIIAPNNPASASDPASNLDQPELASASSNEQVTAMLKRAGDQQTLTNDVNRFLLLMLEIAKEMRSSSREIRNEQANAIVRAKEGAIEQMTLSAKHTYEAAIVAGVGRILGGLCNIAGGIGGSNESMAIGKGVGEGLGGAFDIGAAAAKDKAAQADIARANWDKAAEIAQTAQSNANDTVREMLDLIKSLQQVLQQTDQSRVDTVGKILQRI